MKRLGDRTRTEWKQERDRESEIASVYKLGGNLMLIFNEREEKEAEKQQLYDTNHKKMETQGAGA